MKGHSARIVGSPYLIALRQSCPLSDLELLNQPRTKRPSAIVPAGVSRRCVIPSELSSGSPAQLDSPRQAETTAIIVGEASFGGTNAAHSAGKLDPSRKNPSATMSSR